MRNKEAYAVDASVLIYLGTAAAFEAFEFMGSLLAPPSVWNEAVAGGTQKRAPDTAQILAAADAGRVVLVEMDRQLRERSLQLISERRLGAGESEVIALASGLRRPVLDDLRAGRVATELGISHTSTLGLPLIGLREGALDEHQARRLLEQLAAAASPTSTTLLRLLREIEEYGG